MRRVFERQAGHAGVVQGGGAAFRNTLNLAESRGNNAEIGMHFDVFDQPALLVVCDGDVEKTERFTGSLSRDSRGDATGEVARRFRQESRDGCAA